MIVRWRASAFRSRIPLVLFTFAMIYSVLCIFRYQVVTYRPVSKTATQSDISNVRIILNPADTDNFDDDLKQESANMRGGVINVSDEDVFPKLDESVEDDTIITFVNFSGPLLSSKENEIEPINDENKKIEDDKLQKLESNHRYAGSEDYLTKDMQIQNEPTAEDGTYMNKFEQEKRNSSIKEREHDKTYKNGLMSQAAQALNFKHKVEMTENAIISNKKTNLIEMTLKDIQELTQKSPSVTNGNTGTTKKANNTDENNKSFNAFSVEQKARPYFQPATNKNERIYYRKPFRKHEHFSHVTCKDALQISNKTKIGILIPSSTRNIKHPILKNLTLLNTSLPSIYKTLESQYIYRIYVGIDEGDFLQTVQDEIKRMFHCVIPVIVRGKNYVKCVNAIAERAYEDGMDYLVRANDDTRFETFNWTSAGIRTLKGYNPVNIGVVGPTCNEGNIEILTHDMVHRTHLEIFDFYYPPYLENWWTDDWITRVYEPGRSTKLESWIVKHVEFETRYKVDNDREFWCKTLVEYDKKRLQVYLGCSCSCAVNILLSVPLALIWLLKFFLNST